VDFTKPVESSYIVGAIALIFGLIAIGLAVVKYYKDRKKQEI